MTDALLTSLPALLLLTIWDPCRCPAFAAAPVLSSLSLSWSLPHHS